MREFSTFLLPSVSYWGISSSNKHGSTLVLRVFFKVLLFTVNFLLSSTLNIYLSPCRLSNHQVIKTFLFRFCLLSGPFNKIYMCCINLHHSATISGTSQLNFGVASEFIVSITILGSSSVQLQMALKNGNINRFWQHVVWLTTDFIHLHLQESSCSRTITHYKFRTYITNRTNGICFKPIITCVMNKV